MRFIIIMSVITLSKCINNDMFLAMWGDIGWLVGLAGVVAFAMDALEFIKKREE